MLNGVTILHGLCDLSNLDIFDVYSCYYLLLKGLREQILGITQYLNFPYIEKAHTTFTLLISM